jgi:hypothetical protein
MPREIQGLWLLECCDSAKPYVFSYLFPSTEGKDRVQKVHLFPNELAGKGHVKLLIAFYGHELIA